MAKINDDNFVEFTPRGVFTRNGKKVCRDWFLGSQTFHSFKFRVPKRFHGKRVKIKLIADDHEPDSNYKFENHLES